MKKEEIFRDTGNWYLETENCASDRLIKFAVQYAGDTILDVGCATGDYCNKLKKLGFNCSGIDINQSYIEKALEKGIEAQIMSAENIEFLDNSFDTILLFEVLEHVKNPDRVLEEVKRVAKKNILITVPNCSDFHHLKKYCLTYEHMLEKDHINFFTRESLEKLLSKHFKNFKVEEKEPIALEIVNLPRWLEYPILILNRMGIIKNNISYRLYAVVEV